MRALALPLALAASPALACLGPQFETAVFLPALGEAQAEAPMAARVLVEGRDEALYTVRVIEPIRGAEMDEAFLVPAFGTSCSRNTDVEIGSEWFVAGTPADGVIGAAWPLVPFD